MDRNGQVAVVTGGSRGIGAAITRRLAARGVAVGINYMARGAEAEALRAEIIATGARAATLGQISLIQRRSRRCSPRWRLS
jgi:3-oxoacyl-[acyl-carrier protein] reductase